MNFMIKEKYNIKLCVVSSKLFYFDGSFYKTTGGYGKVMEGLSTFFDELILCNPVKKVKKFDGYQIKSKNVRYSPLPFYSSRFEFMKKLPIILIRILKTIIKSDLIHINLNPYESLFTFFFAKLLNKPVFIYMGGDWEWASYYWRYKNHKLLTKTWAFFNKVFTRMIIYHSISFLAGDVIYSKYYKKGKQIYLTSNSTLLEKDIIKYRDTCQDKKIKLLFVGRLSPEKRIPSLIEATKILNSEGYPCRLIIVGDGKEEKLIDVIKKSKINFLELKGYIPLGEKLYDVYRKSDIFIFPSDENTIAKVVLEAMANGLPIIVSNCGAAPRELENNKNVLLINPGDAQQIVQSVEMIINNTELRQNIIKNNLITIKNYTLNKILNERMEILKRSNKKLRKLLQ